MAAGSSAPELFTSFIGELQIKFKITRMHRFLIVRNSFGSSFTENYKHSMVKILFLNLVDQ